jgi:hypothetical protein
MRMRCPVQLDDDTCEHEIVLDVSKSEKATWFYPGCPEEFEVTECHCGHRQRIEDDYQDDVWSEVRDNEIAQLEAKAEARYDDMLYERRYGREW